MSQPLWTPGAEQPATPNRGAGPGPAADPTVVPLTATAGADPAVVDPVEADDDAPETPAGTIRIGRFRIPLSREARFGLAVVLSFVVLVGVLVADRVRRKPAAVADAAAGKAKSPKDPPVASIPSLPEPDIKGPKDPEPGAPAPIVVASHTPPVRSPVGADPVHRTGLGASDTSPPAPTAPDPVAPAPELPRENGTPATPDPVPSLPPAPAEGSAPSPAPEPAAPAGSLLLPAPGDAPTPVGGPAPLPAEPVTTPGDTGAVPPPAEAMPAPTPPAAETSPPAMPAPAPVLDPPAGSPADSGLLPMPTPLPDPPAAGSGAPAAEAPPAEPGTATSGGPGAPTASPLDGAPVQPAPAPEAATAPAGATGGVPVTLPEMSPAGEPPAAKPKAADPGGGQWVTLPNTGMKAAPAPVDVDPRPRSSAVRDAGEPTAGPEAVAAASPDDAAGMVDPLPHEVRSGENFWTIARSYYGNGRFWKALWYANRGAVKTPEALAVGQVIRIPPPEGLNRALIASSADPAPVARSASPTSGTASPPATVRRASRPGDEVVDLPAADPFSRRRARADEVDPDPDANAGPDDSAPAPTPRRPRYRVRPHETLRSIARDLLGDSRRANEIRTLNAEAIPDPLRLAPGQVLVLPEDAKVGLSATADGNSAAPRDR